MLPPALISTELPERLLRLPAMVVEPLNWRVAPLALSTLVTLEAPVKMVEPPKLLVSEESVVVPVAELKRRFAFWLFTTPRVTAEVNCSVPPLTVVVPA